MKVIEPNREIILVTGGTGRLGTSVVRQLLARGNYHVRVLSREPDQEVRNCTYVKGDLTTGLGLKEALRRVSAIIHCASNPRDPQRVDVEGTANLLAARRNEGKPHLIYISITGVDQTDYAYYRSKLQVERLIAESAGSYSILRTTQFHDFVFNLLNTIEPVNGELSIPAGLQFQPVEVNEVAARLIALLTSKAQGRLPDFGGPEVLTLEQLTKEYIHAKGKVLRIKSVMPTLEREKMFASGINVIPDHTYGKIRWAEYLATMI